MERGAGGNSAEGGGIKLAKNSKEVQKRADDKRRGTRNKAWQGLWYPESGTLRSVINTLEAMQIPSLISPLHDADKRNDGSGILLKPHHHILLVFNNPTGHARAIEVFDAIGATYPNPEVALQEFLMRCRVGNLKAAARYLCHLDNPDKHQYSVDDVVSIGGIDYSALVMTQADYDNTLSDIFSFMDDYEIETYPQLVRLMNKLHPEWRNIIYSKNTRQVVEYAKGIHYERNQRRR